ncbi:MAG: hypothetical protein U0R78_18330 [Nocardioidaceae bacterium]
MLLIGVFVAIGIWAIQMPVVDSSCSPLRQSTEDSTAVGHTLATKQKAVVTVRNRLDAAQAAAASAPSAKTSSRLLKAQQALSAAEAALDQSRVNLSLSDDVKTTFAIGRRVDAGTYSIRFQTDAAVAGSRVIPVTVTPFVRESGPDLRSDAVAAWATMDPDRQHGTVYICMDPMARLHADDGQYTASVSLDPRRFNQMQIPVSVTMAYPLLARVAALGLVVCLACSFWVYILRTDSLSDLIVFGKHLKGSKAGQAASLEDQRELADETNLASRVLRPPFGFWQGYARWFACTSGLITIVAGVLAASAAFTAQYLASQTWEMSLPNVVKYVGAVGTAFVAGATTGRILGNKDPNTRNPS